MYADISVKVRGLRACDGNFVSCLAHTSCRCRNGKHWQKREKMNGATLYLPVGTPNEPTRRQAKRHCCELRGFRTVNGNAAALQNQKGLIGRVTWIKRLQNYMTMSKECSSALACAFGMQLWKRIERKINGVRIICSFWCQPLFKVVSQCQGICPGPLDHVEPRLTV